MNRRSIFSVLSYLLLILGLGQALSGLVGAGCGDSSLSLYALFAPAVVAVCLGVLGARLTRGNTDLSRRDGIGAVAFGWIFMTLYGALPLWISGTIPDFLSAWFESVSGFTTTGASVIGDVDAQAKGILFWRSFTHFLGGMGVLVLCVAILPFLGSGGYQMYASEAPGIIKDRLTPRITSTAKLLYGVYCLLVLLNTLALKIGGMSLYDAFCHAFGTIATGGFSTHTASIGHYNSVYIEIVTIVFMFVGMTNFVLHVQLARGGSLSHYWRHEEFRFFLCVWLTAASLVAASLWMNQRAGPWGAIRDAVFAVTSLMSTTGFVTRDFDAWPAFAVGLLMVVGIFGGCSGSTGGGMKQDRMLVVCKKIGLTLRQFLQPKAILSLKINRHPLNGETVAAVLAFFALYLLTIGLATLLLMFWIPDLRTAVSSVIVTVGCVGPGLGAAGATETYSSFPDGAKGVLIFCMLLGRLEFFSLLVILAPGFWKK